MVENLRYKSSTSETNMASALEQTASAVPVVATAVKERILVAAIDFGTTYSGYAFSLHNDFEDDPLKIFSANWTKGSNVMGSHKTSTCILFNEDGIFHSFGYEAEAKYNELAIEGQHYGWFFFRRFKMVLYDHQALERDIKLKDERKLEMAAIYVFTASIKYLKDHLIRNCKEKNIGVEPNEFHWVITVPAIWGDSAKQFMREAAVHAEIHTDKLSLALEPEAASLFCRYLPTERVVGVDSAEIRCFTAGEKYMILDAGGGTVDITVHEVLKDNTLKELHKANGGEWGGTTIDKYFERLLCKIVGPDVMEIMQNRYRDDYSDMMEDFEMKKRTITPDRTQKVKFSLPSFVRTTYKEMNNQELKDSNLIDVNLRAKLSFTADKIKIDADVIKELFKETCDNITEHLKSVFTEISRLKVQKILMVGGFSESPMLQHAVRTAFPYKRLIIPEEAGLAVLKGAVIFGHCPNMVRYRVCQTTYGIQAFKQFEPALDPPSKRVVIGDHVLCKDAFSKHAEVDQLYLVGEKMKPHEYVPREPGLKEMSISVYSSPRHNPVHIDERDCKKIGDMKVQLLDTEDGNDKTVLVQFVLGNTELGVEATEKKTGEKTKACFEFLSKN